MDWEKQDNEIRKLLEEENFLPEGDVFDERRTWQKLSTAMMPKATFFHARFIRIAIAACLVGVISFFALRFNAKHHTKKDPVVKENTMDNNEESEALLSFTEPSAINEHDSRLSVEKIDLEQKEPYGKYVKDRTDMGIKKTNMHQYKEDIIAEHTEKSAIDITEKVYTETIEMDAPLNKEVATAQHEISKPVPAMTGKIRVVHYNELNRNKTIAPPGFVKSNKSEELLNAFTVMNPLPKNQYENAFQIKIELTPQVKKSL
jgi:hypothetical protein